MFPNNEKLELIKHSRDVIYRRVLISDLWNLNIRSPNFDISNGINYIGIHFMVILK